MLSEEMLCTPLSGMSQAVTLVVILVTWFTIVKEVYRPLSTPVWGLHMYVAARPPYR